MKPGGGGGGEEGGGGVRNFIFVRQSTMTATDSIDLKQFVKSQESLIHSCKPGTPHRNLH